MKNIDPSAASNALPQIKLYDAPTTPASSGGELCGGVAYDSLGMFAQSVSLEGASFEVPQGGLLVTARLTVDDEGSLSISNVQG